MLEPQDPPSPSRPPRLLLFGTPSRFSSGVLGAIFAASLPVAAVVMAGPARAGSPPILRQPPPPAARRGLPIAGAAGQATLVEQAWQSDCPVFRVQSLRDAETLATLAALEPTLCVVACFSQRLPASVLGRSALGGINVHPSLLPAGRGPDPRFWAFRLGLVRTGVTVHLLTERFDAGPIVAQTALDLPRDATGDDFDRLTAQLGGALVIHAIAQLHAGQAKPLMQDERLATYQPAPTLDDYALPLDQPANAVARFIRGVVGDDSPLHVDLGDQRVFVRRVAAIDDQGRLDQPWLWRDSWLWLQCQPGAIAVVPASSCPTPRTASGLAFHESHNHVGSRPELGNAQVTHA
jgi:methionyl-tRNA formyltransferase